MSVVGSGPDGLSARSTNAPCLIARGALRRRLIPDDGAERRGRQHSSESEPAILTTPNEVETWMSAPADEALKLQWPLPNGSLRIVARGVKKNPSPAD